MSTTETAIPAIPPLDGTPAGHEPRHHGLPRAFAASLIGTSLEYFDFAIFGSAAALVFGPLFFAHAGGTTGLLAAFTTYAFGFVARPLGGLIFGRLGDLIGRKRVLVITLLLAGSSTFLIGLLPTYEHIGMLAPALLVFLRFVQGVGVGGEWGGAVLITSELSRESERGLWSSAAQIGPPAGTLLANGTLAALALLPQAQFQSWGWRVAFLLSAVLVGFGLWIRTRLEETDTFREMASKGTRPSAPVREVLTSQRRGLAAVILARMGPDVLYSMFAVYVLAYAPSALGTPHAQAQAIAAVAAGSALQLFLVPLSGWLSDRWGRRRVYAAGALAAIVWVSGFFALVHDFPSLLIGVVGALACHSLMYGPQAAFITEQFPAHLRSTGSSLGYTFAGLVGAAIAPLVFTALRDRYPAWSIGVYIAFACLMSLVGLRLARRWMVPAHEASPPSAPLQR